MMSDKAIKKLKCFQGEIAKRILQMPKWYSIQRRNYIEVNEVLASISGKSTAGAWL